MKKEETVDQTAANEIRAIAKKRNGRITPNAVVAAAKNPKKPVAQVFYLERHQSGERVAAERLCMRRKC